MIVFKFVDTSYVFSWDSWNIVLKNSPERVVSEELRGHKELRDSFIIIITEPQSASSAVFLSISMKHTTYYNCRCYNFLHYKYYMKFGVRFAVLATHFA